MNRPLFATLAALATSALALTSLAAEEGFVSLFDGKTLSGWEGNNAIWSVKDGAITGQTGPETNLKHNTFLVWKGGQVDDFELRFRYRIVKGNSGVQYRSKVAEQGPQGPIVGGYQADFEAGTTYSGILYEERGRGILAQRGQKVVVRPAAGGKHKVEVTGSVGNSADIQATIQSEQWNDYVVVARGNHLVHTINGRTTVDVTDEDAAHAAKSGVLAFQVHVGPPMTVQLKDVRLKKLGGTDAAAADLDRMQGEWVGASGMRDGNAIPEEWISSIKLNIKGGKYDIAWTDGGDAGTLKVNPNASPKQIDVHSDANGMIEGIYEFKDGKLTIAHGADGAGRPKDMASAANSSAVILTYRRK